MTYFKKYFPYIYIIALLLIFFYARNVANTVKLEVSEKTKEKPAQEIKPVKISIEVYNTNKLINSYKVEMENTNTIDDALEEIRDHQNFFYEKSVYTYGTEYDEINGIKASNTQRWAVYEDGSDVSLEAGNTNLTDGSKYKLVLVNK